MAIQFSPVLQHIHNYIDIYIHTYVHMVPNRDPCQTQGLPQAELRPWSFPTRRITTTYIGRLSTSRIITRELPYILPTSRITTRELVMRLAGWLAGVLAGWLAEARRGPERPREAQEGGAWIERACHALGWRQRFWKPFLGTWGPSKKRLPNTYICELLIKLATGATRGLLEAFFRELGPFKRAASQCVSC